ncbi:unnamed protein product [Vitrella brassicaformis CCMP3155]|uniref:Uncharacterized protein n=2 Tax=Vitrella brassicaformis TaxID=1169539 RepID=A0A0G4EMT2_VITBC|nr:unnamed protein product [Vitrella brassicaformis CCMP3155]|mmetsp:Transcript_12054/g.28885  ORF Transcript_12054/g.28885 Transcript_12054/m.28885 type:complete len:223 (+) Transcript_12054:73-741(+)|eukprot:CEL98124.1 unnamed protein product [Vitrella brassicaformis CCMP3155]
MTELTANSGTKDRDPLQELNEYRRQHQQKYQERLEQEEKLQKQAEDEAVARKYQEEEERMLQQQHMSDAEYSRQLFEQVNQMPAPPIEGLNHSDAHQYHAQYDPAVADEGDDVRSPMRSGYVDRLLDPEPPLFYAGTRGLNEGSMRLLDAQGDVERGRLWRPLPRCIEDAVSDEQDRRTGWRCGSCWCTRNTVLLYMVVSSLLSLMVVLLLLKLRPDGPPAT